MCRHTGWIVCFVFAGGVLAAGSVAAGQEQGRPLSDHREEDRAWGLSLRPPVDTQVLRRTADRYLMRIVDDEERFKLFVSVKRLKRPLTVPLVLTAAEADLLRLHETAKALDAREMEVAGRPAGLAYFDVPRTRGAGRMLVGQAYIQMAPDTFALVEIESALEDRASAAATFEAVVESVELGGLQDVEAQRMADTQRAAELQGRLTPEALREAVVPQQLFRIVESPGGGGADARAGRGKDIGWMRLRQGPAERVGKPGVYVEVQARFFVEDQAYDSIAGYFVAEDRSYEDWTVKTTLRPAESRPARRGGAARRSPAPGGPDPTPTATETGIRTGSRIEVRIDRQGGESQNLTFSRPEAAYLSQAEAWLLPQLVPPDQPASYGFYWYSGAHQKLVYRTDQVVPALDRFTLITRPAPNDAELRSTHRSDGTLIEKHLSATRKLIPTTAEELKRLWPER